MKTGTTPHPPSAPSPRKRGEGPWITLALFIALVASAAGAATLDEYIAALTRIDITLRANQLDDARGEARRFLGVEIQSPHGTFRADDALLKSIIDAKKADIHLVERLESTIVALKQISPEPAGARGDHKLLDALARAEEVAGPRAGGEAIPDDQLATGAMVRFSEATQRALKWVGDKLSAFFDWLMSFWPESREKDKPSGHVRWIVIAVAVIIVILIGTLAYIALRHSRAAQAAPVESAAPAMSARDEDPLSRGANEWERYAAQLAAAGRAREAIRAWYHAVLVTLYAASILHFRKGRTNWEYVAMLAPALPWRGEFVELTRRFEVEWYGLHESAEEALEECRETARRIIDSVRRASRSAA